MARVHAKSIRCAAQTIGQLTESMCGDYHAPLWPMVLYTLKFLWGQYFTDWLQKMVYFSPVLISRITEPNWHTHSRLVAHPIILEVPIALLEASTCMVACSSPVIGEVLV